MPRNIHMTTEWRRREFDLENTGWKINTKRVQTLFSRSMFAMRNPAPLLFNLHFSVFLFTYLYIP